MSQTQDLSAAELSVELAKAIAANRKFIAEIDQRISRADRQYLQTLIAEKKGYLRLAKKKIKA